MIKVFCDICGSELRVKGNYGKHYVEMRDADGHFYQLSLTLCSNHAKQLYEYIEDVFCKNLSSE